MTGYDIDHHSYDSAGDRGGVCTPFKDALRAVTRVLLYPPLSNASLTFVHSRRDMQPSILVIEVEENKVVIEENKVVIEENKDVDINISDFFMNTFRDVFGLCSDAPAYALLVHTAASEELMKPPRYVFILIRAHS